MSFSGLWDLSKCLGCGEDSPSWAGQWGWPPAVSSIILALGTVFPHASTCPVLTLLRLRIQLL